MLTSSIIGVVEKAKVIDGSAIRAGDRVLSVASNGLHTNGYTLVRALLKKRPALARARVGKTTFLNAILEPHLCYYSAIKQIRDLPGLHGMAHITGSGIQGNLERVLPASLDAVVDLELLTIPDVFRVIRKEGRVTDKEMLRTYNMGSGLMLVTSPDAAKEIAGLVRKMGFACADVGEIVPGSRQVRLEGTLSW